MIITTEGTKLDMTAIAEQFNISTPVSLTLDRMTVPDSFVFTSLAVLAFVTGGIIFIGTKKLFKRR